MTPSRLRARLERAGAPASPELEQRLTELLKAAAEQVNPSPNGLERIRARILAARAGRARWRRWWRRPHTCRQLADWLDPEDVRCWCGARPTDTPAAPDWTSGAAVAAPLMREDTAMASIPRRAKELRVGDIIVTHPDPDQNGTPVRWRVSKHPTITGRGVVIIDYVDLDDPGKSCIAWCDAMRNLRVEPGPADNGGQA